MIEDIKKLRLDTGVGVLECKEALEKCNGNVEASKIYMRKLGIINSKSRGHKTTPEGAIGTYIHIGDRIVAIVEVLCETDFVSRSNEFKEFAYNLAIHIAAMKPLWIDKNAVPLSIVETEKDIILDSLKGKPDEIKEKIIQGKLNKFYKENCLIEQSFIKDQKISIKDMYNDICLKLKENIIINRFSRFEIGLD